MAKIKVDEKEIENKLRKLPENLKKEVLSAYC
jgi:ribosomal protein S21